jgi:hypothetical protein
VTTLSERSRDSNHIESLGNTRSFGAQSKMFHSAARAQRRQLAGGEGEPRTNYCETKLWAFSCPEARPKLPVKAVLNEKPTSRIIIL